MKKCLLYGNCQAEALKLYLSKDENFSTEYEIVQLPPVHLLNREHVTDLLEKITSVDLFIHQPISDNYKNIPELGSEFLKSKLKKRSQSFSFPSIFFRGYHPEMIGLKSLENQNINEPYSYFDGQFLKHILIENADFNRLESIFFDEHFYSAQYVKGYFEECLNELKRREQGVDFKVSDIIEEDYRKEKLFHVFNHPSAMIITKLYHKIIKQLFGIDLGLTFKLGPDTLARIKYPMYHSIKKHMDLDFDIPFVYKIAQDYIEPKEFIEKNIAFVKSQPRVIELNLKRYGLI